MFAIQVYDGQRLLPRLVVDSDVQHKAERLYCDHFGLERQNIRYFVSKASVIPGRICWIESGETSDERFDLQ